MRVRIKGIHGDFDGVLIRSNFNGYHEVEVEGRGCLLVHDSLIEYY